MKQKLGMKANRAELFSRFGILLIFALVVLVASLVSDRFLSTDNILSVFTQCTVIGVLSCGMTMLIVSGNTDLSAGSGVALAGVVCALVINASGSWVLAVLATVAVMLLAVRLTAMAPHPLLRAAAYPALLYGGLVLLGIVGREDFRWGLGLLRGSGGK